MHKPKAFLSVMLLRRLSFPRYVVSAYKGSIKLKNKLIFFVLEQMLERKVVTLMAQVVDAGRTKQWQ